LKILEIYHLIEYTKEVIFLREGKHVKNCSKLYGALM
jgi:hypothetical protein